MSCFLKSCESLFFYFKLIHAQPLHCSSKDQKAGEYGSFEITGKGSCGWLFGEGWVGGWGGGEAETDL